jgi:cytochrome c-type biogenesis protein CcmE
MIALSVIGTSLDRDLMIYDLVLNMKLFAMPADFLQERDPDLLLRCLILGGGYILASTIGGILLFRKAEIK